MECQGPEKRQNIQNRSVSLPLSPFFAIKLAWDYATENIIGANLNARAHKVASRSSRDVAIGSINTMNNSDENGGGKREIKSLQSRERDKKNQGYELELVYDDDDRLTVACDVGMDVVIPGGTELGRPNLDERASFSTKL